MVEQGTLAATNRKLHLDILKVLAIFFVMFNHTGTEGFFLFSKSQGSLWYGVYLFISIITKIAVPLFFMISGALLLNKMESWKHILKKRFLRYFIILVFFSFLQYLWSLGFQLQNCSITDFFKGFYF